MTIQKQYLVLPQYIYLKRTSATKGQHHHFVEYKWNPNSSSSALCLTTRQGRVGNNGHTYHKTFYDVFKIQKELLKRLKHKIAEGFLPFGCNNASPKKPASISKKIKLDTQRITNKLDQVIQEEKKQCKHFPRVKSPSKFLAERRRLMVSEQESPSKKRKRVQEEDELDSTHVTPILPRKRRRTSLSTSTSPQQATAPIARRLLFDDLVEQQPQQPSTSHDYDDDDFGAPIGFANDDDEDDDMLATPLQPAMLFSQAESNSTLAPLPSQDSRVRQLELENQELLTKMQQVEERLHQLQQSVYLQQTDLAQQGTRLALDQEALTERCKEFETSKEAWTLQRAQEQATLAAWQQRLQVQQDELTQKAHKLEQDLQEQAMLQNTLHALRDHLYAQETEYNKKQQELQSAISSHEQAVAQQEAQWNANNSAFASSKLAFELECEQERNKIAQEWQALRTQLANHEQSKQEFFETISKQQAAIQTERSALQQAAAELKQQESLLAIKQAQLNQDQALFSKQQDDLLLRMDEERIKKQSVDDLRKTCEAFVASTKRLASRRREMYKTQQTEMQQAIAKMFQHLQDAETAQERELYSMRKMEVEEDADDSTPTPTTAKKLQEIWDTQATVTLSK